MGARKDEGAREAVNHTEFKTPAEAREAMLDRMNPRRHRHELSPEQMREIMLAKQRWAQMSDYEQKALKEKYPNYGWEDKT